MDPKEKRLRGCGLDSASSR